MTTTTASLISLPAAGNQVALSPRGIGVYDLRFDATTLAATATGGRYILAFDRFCGWNAEGQTYRRFVMEVTPAEAIELVRVANLSPSWVEDFLSTCENPRYRASRAPVWMRSFA